MGAEKPSTRTAVQSLKTSGKANGHMPLTLGDRTVAGSSEFSAGRFLGARPRTDAPPKAANSSLLFKIGLPGFAPAKPECGVSAFCQWNNAAPCGLVTTPMPPAPPLLNQEGS